MALETPVASEQLHTSQMWGSVSDIAAGMSLLGNSGPELPRGQW